MEPYAKLYPWVGRDVDLNSECIDNAKREYIIDKASFFVMATLSEIAIGGGGNHFGLWLNEDLSYGTTGTCLTFENEPLTGNPGKTKFN